ncbi:MAG: hypothetical protein IT285_02680 [Bdellovibrionales bacterium]|nr:hypothetical protein [Bdellovibrionales bacterium]
MKAFQRSIALFAALTASVALTGCDSISSPQGVVQSAYKALMKNDVKKFPKFLSGEAKQEYGHLEGMIALQRVLLAYDTHQVGETTLLETVTGANGRPTLRKYSVQVVAKNDVETAFSPVMLAKVDCQIRYSMEHVGGTCGLAAPAHHGSHGGGGGGPVYSGPYHPGYGAGYCHPGHATLRQDVYCSITDIE